MTSHAARRKQGRAAAAVVLVALLSGTAPLAHADPTASSTATFTLTGGSLSIAVLTDDADLGRHQGTGAVLTVTGSLGRVAVTDRRGAPPGSGWTASAVSTAFTADGGLSIAAARVSYETGPVTVTGTVRCAARNPRGLTRARPVVVATDVSGDNTATWRPTISVEVPAGQPVGVYSGTITHSVA